jgi:hypothetical protein
MSRRNSAAFSVSHRIESRFVRFTLTDKNLGGHDYLRFVAVEFFGTLWQYRG